MARVVAHVPDLLFGSRVQGMLVAAGHDVDLVVPRSRMAREGAALVDRLAR